MRILQISETPVHEILYLNARRGGGTEAQRLPILRGHVDRLPDAVEALLVTSDLQGVVPSWQTGGNTMLLGEALADELLALCDDGHLPYPTAVGVVLAGDLYAAPGGDKRGASGDVRAVWDAFASTCRWVAGVAGNHDRFGSERDLRRLCNRPNVYFLDGQTEDIDGWRVAGVGGIMGKPGKPGRRSEDDFLDTLNRAIDGRPSVMVLHQGPHGDDDQRGDALIRETLELGEIPLTICGHSHWDRPLATLAGDHQALNVDARAVILTVPPV